MIILKIICYFRNYVKLIFIQQNNEHGPAKLSTTSSAAMTFTTNPDRKISRDAAPHIDNYRTGYNTQHSLTRPTLPELYDPTGNSKVINKLLQQDHCSHIPKFIFTNDRTQSRRKRMLSIRNIQIATSSAGLKEF